MNLATAYLTKGEYEALPKFPSRSLAEESGIADTDRHFIYNCDNGQELLVKDGEDFVVEVRKAKSRKKTRADRRVTHGPASLEARYNIDFPEGLTRAAKRMYIAGLKKAMKKKVAPNSPAYWRVLANYGFKPLEKKVDNG